MFIVLVEDDPYIAQSICAALNYLNISVEHVSHARAADYFIRHSAVDLCLLDLGLPDQDGLDLLHSWRRDQIDLPVLVLTARLRTDQCVQALNAGADDYLTKPFQVAELVARVQALVRRAAGNASSILEIGGVRLDMAASQVWYEGTPIKLTAHEFRVLGYLMQHRGKVVSRSEMIDHIYAQDFDRDSNTVEVFIGRIRKKTHADLIETVRGLGYRINE